MKRKISKLIIILLMFQVIICFSNIHMVNAIEDMDTVAENFYKTGSKKVSSLGITMDLLLEPSMSLWSIVHFIAIASSTGYLLVTCLNLLRENTFDKAKAKKIIGVRIFLVFLAVAGVPWGIRLFRIILPTFIP